MAPKVTIIILNWNGLSDTTECLTSLQSVTYPNFDVLVVDNDSSNNESKVLRERFGSFIEVLENSENFGFAKGNNLGIQRALDNSADYVLLLNNDTVVQPDFLDLLVDTAQSSNAGIVGPKILVYSTDKISAVGGTIHWFSRFITRHVTDPTHKVTAYPFLTGCCLLIKREVFKKIGLLNESYFLYYEDTDFCMRTAQAGYTIVVDPKATIWHKISQSVKHESAWYHYYTNRNTLLFCKNNAPFPVFLYHYIQALSTLAYIKIRLLTTRDAAQRTRLIAVQSGIRDFVKGKFGKKSH